MNVTSLKTRQQSRASSAARAPVREHYHHGDLPAALKRAALTLIARHGVDGFSLREAAMAVGVSPSAAYRHFEDKAALLRAIAVDAFADLGQRFDTAMTSVRGASARAARARFMGQGEAYVGFALEHPERFAVMFGPHGAGAYKAADCADAQPRSPYATLSRALDELTDAGVILPARRVDAELLVWPAIHGLATLLVSGAITPGPGGVTAMVRKIGEDCLRSLR
jgi:AcrR family transcriptional regulator